MVPLKRPVEATSGEEERPTSRVDLQAAMALMSEEQPLAAGVAAVTAPENGRDAAPSIDRSLRSTSQEQLHQQVFMFSSRVTCICKYVGVS